MVYDKYTIDIIDNLRHQYGLDNNKFGGDLCEEQEDSNKKKKESI